MIINKTINKQWLEVMLNDPLESTRDLAAHLRDNFDKITWAAEHHYPEGVVMMMQHDNVNVGTKRYKFELLQRITDTEVIKLTPGWYYLVYKFEYKDLTVSDRVKYLEQHKNDYNCSCINYLIENYNYLKDRACGQICVIYSKSDIITGEFCFSLLEARAMNRHLVGLRRIAFDFRTEELVDLNPPQQADAIKPKPINVSVDELTRLVFSVLDDFKDCAELALDSEIKCSDVDRLFAINDSMDNSQVYRKNALKDALSIIRKVHKKLKSQFTPKE